jgi:deoxyribodipyrimidine photolyase
VIGRDEILDDITLYWLTNTGASSSRFYWENNNKNFSSAAQKTAEIRVPVAITVFPHEIYRAPESWSRKAYPSLYYFHEVSKGGHFAAWEQPQIFSEEMRAAFRPLRALLAENRSTRLQISFSRGIISIPQVFGFREGPLASFNSRNRRSFDRSAR